MGIWIGSWVIADSFLRFPYQTHDFNSVQNEKFGIWNLNFCVKSESNWMSFDQNMMSPEKVTGYF